MARGRKPKPSPDALPAPAAEAAGVAVFDVKPPADLTAGGRAEWERLVPLLAGLAQLHDADQDALRQYVEAVAVWKRAVRELDGAELVLVTPNGAMQMNPLLKVKAQNESLMTKLSERFGLDPASRKRLAMAAAASVPADSMGGFLAGGCPRSSVPFAD